MAVTPNLRYKLERNLWGFVDLAYPPQCAGCGKYGKAWCDDCSDAVTQVSGNICQKCGDPIPSGETCPDCVSHPPTYTVMRSYAIFEGVTRKALLRLKYGGDLGLGFALAWDLAHFVDGLELAPDLVMPVPLGQERLRKRGFNQAHNLAKPMANLLGWQYRSDGVRRVRDTRSQVGLGVAERRENVRDAFLADPRIVTGKTVLLVDDTTTTGATLDFTSCSIIKAGATNVYCIAFAKAHTHNEPTI